MPEIRQQEQQQQEQEQEQDRVKKKKRQQLVQQEADPVGQHEEAA